MRKSGVICGVLLLGLGARAQQVAFQQPASFTAQSGAVALTSGDFNGDGFQDLAVANGGSASVSIALSNGDGTFKPPVVYNLNSSCAANYIYAGDFNHDGHLDLLLSCFFSQAMMILPGNGDGTFKTPVTVALPLDTFTGDVIELVNIQPAIADFDRDGYLDIILPLGDPQGNVLPVPYVLKGMGNFSFQPASPVQGLSGPEIFSFATADFNSDGKPDLAGMQISATKPPMISLVIALGHGDGTFNVVNTYSSPIGFSLHSGDMNGDGIADLIVSGGVIATGKGSLVAGGVDVFLGKGDGSFTASSPFEFSTSNSIAYDIALADLRGSGKPDVIVSVWNNLTVGLGEESTSLLVLPSNGDGTFQPPVDVSELSSNALFSLATGDFNGDGRPDVAFVTAPSSTLAGLSFKGDTFTASEIFSALDAMPPGGVQALINSTPPASFTDTNDANFKPGPQAQDSILAAFGGGLSSQTAPAATPVLTLGGVNVNVKDSAGVTRAAPLFYVSPKQVNYAIPAGTATGPAAISIVNGATAAVATQQIVPVQPGLFAVGPGIAAANVASYLPGAAAPELAFPFQVSKGAIVLNPIVIDPNAQVYLFLYGTGIRHAMNVTANLGSLTNQPVEYAGAQGFYVGEDQINVLLPQSLKGAGVINLTLTADGFTTNAVQIEFNSASSNLLAKR